MNVYIVGAGAVGTFLGDRLTAGGATVAYAPRSLEAVVPVACDLAIVAVKAYDTDGAIETLRKALASSPQATILCPQNGVGNEEKLAAVFGPDAIVSAALTVPVEKSRDGKVSASNRGGIALAPVGTQAHNWLVAAFDDAPPTFVLPKPPARLRACAPAFSGHSIAARASTRAPRLQRLREKVVFVMAWS